MAATATGTKSSSTEVRPHMPQRKFRASDEEWASFAEHCEELGTDVSKRLRWLMKQDRLSPVPARRRGTRGKG